MAIGTEESSTLPPAKPDADAADGAKPAVPAIPATKKPPPESIESVRTRHWVIFSFWAVVLFLGLPIWLWTTSIHRAHLPLQEMLDWADGKVAFTWLAAFVCRTN